MGVSQGVPLRVTADIPAVAMPDLVLEQRGDLRSSVFSVERRGDMSRGEETRHRGVSMSVGRNLSCPWHGIVL